MLSFTWQRQDLHKPLTTLQKPPNGQTTKQTNKKAGTRNQTCIQKVRKSNTYNGTNGQEESIAYDQESDSPLSCSSLVRNGAQRVPAGLLTWVESTEIQRKVRSYPSYSTKLCKTNAPDKKIILCKLSQEWDRIFINEECLKDQGKGLWVFRGK